MSERHDMDDDKIRVIEGRREEPEKTPPQAYDFSEPAPRRRLTRRWIVAGIVAFVLIALVAVLAFSLRSRYASTLTTVQRGEVCRDAYAMAEEMEMEMEMLPQPAAQARPADAPRGYTEMIDTLFEGHELTLLIPHDAVPSLEVGMEHLSDTTAVLLLQAADVRGDNGQINCAFVRRGQMLARGERKAGYCAIIDGSISVGVERYSPLLEQAMEKGGDFFRQYPLVAGGQPVANVLKSRSLRRALVQTADKTFVVMTKERMSLDEFAAILADMGADQAIYLTGSTAPGVIRLQDGTRLDIGHRDEWQNITFIIWH